MKYFLSHSFSGNYDFLQELDDRVPKEVDCVEDADILILTGGADINPKLYDHPKSASTHYNEHLDSYILDIYNEAVKIKIPILGICRGLQFLNVMQGGTLVQHVNNHVGTAHLVEDLSSKVAYKVNSLHHQLVVPANSESIVLARAYPAQGTQYVYGKPLHHLTAPPSTAGEIEAVFFPSVMALGVQWHPELDSEVSGSVLLVRKYLTEYLKDYYETT